MHRKLSYLVERNGYKIWLVQCAEPLPTDIILEKRCLLVADDGKILTKNGEIIGGCIRLINPDDRDIYNEIDTPPDEEEQPEVIQETN